MKTFCIVAALFLVTLAGNAGAQVLNVPQTLGAGNQSIFISENRLYIEGDQLNVAYGQYARGLNDRFDFCVATGQTRFGGRGQMYVAVGGNWNLFTWKKFSLSAYNMVSVPVTRRDEASLVLLNAMLVAGYRVNDRLALVSGLNSLWPIGKAEQGVFTPPDKKINVPVGAAVSFGKWTLFGEADVGRLSAWGVGLARGF